MGAGLSKSRKYGITRRELSKIQRELAQGGVKTIYKDWALHSVPNGLFSAYVSWGNMSNGESVGELVVAVNGKRYGWMKPAGDVKDGLRIIKLKYGHGELTNPRKRRYRRNAKLWRASKVTSRLRRSGHKRFGALIRKLRKKSRKSRSRR